MPLGEDLSSLAICDGEAVFTVSRSSRQGRTGTGSSTQFSPKVSERSPTASRTSCAWPLRRILSRRGFVFDTELAAYVLDPTESAYPLDRLSQRYLGAERPEAQAVYELYPALEGTLERGRGASALLRYRAAALPRARGYGARGLPRRPQGAGGLRREHGRGHKPAAGAHLGRWPGTSST